MYYLHVACLMDGLYILRYSYQFSDSYPCHNMLRHSTPIVYEKNSLLHEAVMWVIVVIITLVPIYYVFNNIHGNIFDSVWLIGVKMYSVQFLQDKSTKQERAENANESD